MAGLTLDDLWTLQTSLLACAEDRLTVPPGRALVVPGSEAAWDDCCTDGGTLWVLVQQISVGWPDPTPEPFPCPHGLTATLELGAVRCVATVDNHGTPPSVAQITDDAERVNRDRFELWEAIVCCWAPTLQSRGVLPVEWLPLGADGGCAGGAWTTNVRVSGQCACPPDPPNGGVS